MSRGAPSIADIQHWRALERGELPATAADAPPIALVYPNTYAVGMASLGYQTTLHQMRRHGLDAQRFFAHAPPLSLDTGMPLHRAEAIAFSVAYELDWLHVLQFLEQARIPLHARDRSERHPLIFAGGVCAMMNRSPGWPFIDFFIHGEAEATIPALAGLLRRGDLPRGELAAHIARLPGLEITAGCAAALGLAEFATSTAESAPPEPLIISDLDAEPCMTRIITPGSEFGDMALVCIARGCPHRCTFCWIGHGAPEYRTATAARVLEWAAWQRQFTNRIGLVASAVGAHPEIDTICRELMAAGAKISYSSLRAEDVTPTMLQALAASGQKTITLAPEAGDARVRRLLGKNIADERFLEVIDWALQCGILSIKLYFMTGIPTETDEEAEAIAGFVARVRERMVAAGKTTGKIGAISVNLGIFVPKPGLPLLRVPSSLAHTQKTARMKRVARLLRKIPNTRVAASSADLAQAQAILSTRHTPAGEFLEQVHQAKGDWRGVLKAWRKANRAEA